MPSSDLLTLVSPSWTCLLPRALCLPLPPPPFFFLFSNSEGLRVEILPLKLDVQVALIFCHVLFGV